MILSSLIMKAKTTPTGEALGLLWGLDSHGLARSLISSIFSQGRLERIFASLRSTESPQRLGSKQISAMMVLPGFKKNKGCDGLIRLS